jgi:hypothetical protein
MKRFIPIGYVIATDFYIGSISIMIGVTHGSNQLFCFGLAIIVMSATMCAITCCGGEEK